MTLFTILALGLMFGMLHALEADHVAAVFTLVARERSLLGTLRHGVAWGVGHTLTLLAFGGVVMLVGTSISEQTAHWLEAAVGVMLVGLGADLLRRLARDRIHFHRHRHRFGAVHIHAHSHRDEHGAHNPMQHQHSHRRLPRRAIAVGMVHGLAGSAAIVLLALDKLGSPLWGVTYVLLFGAGSIVGMALLSLVIALPLRASAKRLTTLHRGVQAVMALVTIGLGMRIFLVSVS
ncbi:MAG: sulfite exporter TauE/SafE family protein [Gallionellaceae bacterium]|nr:sulfite exporter TauE/SafE family protein [Gallionellaceae bacterium]